MIIIMGMFKMSFSSTPGKINKNEPKLEQAIPLPSPWTLNIQVTDACDSAHCTNSYSCSLDIVLEVASSSCVGLYPFGGSIPFVNCQSSYSVQIPDTVRWVYVTLIDNSGSCSLTPSPCCAQRGQLQPCKIRVCQ